MQAIVSIGDIHGLTTWKDIVAMHSDSKIIFLGDYLDPYDYMPAGDLLSNFVDIIFLKKDNPDNVVLLLGNHDVHYFLDVPMASRFDYRIAEKVSALFRKNIDLFCYAFQDGNKLYTHAGVSHEWFIDDFKGDLNRPIADQLNNPDDNQVAALFRVGEHRGGRKGSIGGIFWADVKELTNPLHGYIQIVGHNRVNEVTECKYGNDNSIVFCDCLRNDLYLFDD